ncbi:Crp/Fnr family transcriptional regulator [Aquisalinus luteolus]|nr:Crp/Fnr family transcriptional regulator [Aquisalinus luteolus]
MTQTYPAGQTRETLPRPHRNMLVRKLEGFGPLPEADRKLVARLADGGRQLPPRSDIITEGQNPENVHLIVSGMACRYKLIDSGCRQILAIFLPGDFCDLHVFILDHMDHSISTLTDCTVVDMPRSAVFQMLERPAIAKALWWATLVDEAVLRERLVDIGRRPARERISHLLCEIYVRMQAVGLVDGQSFDFRLTQTDIADALGLTNVSVNKVIMELRRDGVLEASNAHISVLKPDALQAIGKFSDDYLHLT